jgi:hypothetical protein
VIETEEEVALRFAGRVGLDPNHWLAGTVSLGVYSWPNSRLEIDACQRLSQERKGTEEEEQADTNNTTTRSQGLYSDLLREPTSGARFFLAAETSSSSPRRQKRGLLCSNTNQHSSSSSRNQQQWWAPFQYLLTLFSGMGKYTGFSKRISGCQKNENNGLMLEANRNPHPIVSRVRAARSDLSEQFRTLGSWGVGNLPGVLAMTSTPQQKMSTGGTVWAGAVLSASLGPAAAAQGAEAFYALDHSTDWDQRLRCETSCSFGPWWQAELREASHIVDVTIYRPLLSTSAGHKPSNTVDSSHSNRKNGAAEEDLWVFLGAAQNPTFNNVHDQLVPSPVDDASNRLASLKKASSVFQRLHNKEHCWTEPNPDINNNATTPPVLLQACRWTLDEPSLAVGFVRVELRSFQGPATTTKTTTHSAGTSALEKGNDTHKEVSLRLAEVVIRGLPSSKTHPIVLPARPGPASYHPGGVSESDYGGGNQQQCDLETYNRCPGNIGLVACLTGGSTGIKANKAAAAVGSERLEEGGSSSCACLERALRCFEGKQRGCPGASVISDLVTKHKCADEFSSPSALSTSTVPEKHAHESAGLSDPGGAQVKIVGPGVAIAGARTGPGSSRAQ